MGSFVVLSYQSINFFLIDRGEDFDVFFCIIIADVQPELVELVG